MEAFNAASAAIPAPPASIVFQTLLILLITKSVLGSAFLFLYFGLSTLCFVVSRTPPSGEGTNSKYKVLQRRPSKKAKPTLDRKRKIKLFLMNRLIAGYVYWPEVLFDFVKYIALGSSQSPRDFRIDPQHSLLIIASAVHVLS